MKSATRLSKEIVLIGLFFKEVSYSTIIERPFPWGEAGDDHSVPSSTEAVIRYDMI